jgi:hypothetical protein
MAAGYLTLFPIIGEIILKNNNKSCFCRCLGVPGTTDEETKVSQLSPAIPSGSRFSHFKFRHFNIFDFDQKQHLKHHNAVGHNLIPTYVHMYALLYIIELNDRPFWFLANMTQRIAVYVPSYPASVMKLIASSLASYLPTRL